MNAQMFSGENNLNTRDTKCAKGEVTKLAFTGFDFVTVVAFVFKKD